MEDEVNICLNVYVQTFPALWYPHSEMFLGLTCTVQTVLGKLLDSCCATVV